MNSRFPTDGIANLERGNLLQKDPRSVNQNPKEVWRAERNDWENQAETGLVAKQRDKITQRGPATKKPNKPLPIGAESAGKNY